jgi:hypothetical protein
VVVSYLYILIFPFFSGGAALLQLHIFIWDVQLFRPEHPWGDFISRMRTLCIKIGNVLVLHFNPWVEGLYSPVDKYFGTCLIIRIWIKLSRKSRFYKFISKRIISLMHSSILRRIGFNFMTLCLGSLFFRRGRSFTVTHVYFRFPTFSAWASLRRLY